MYFRAGIFWKKHSEKKYSEKKYSEKKYSEKKYSRWKILCRSNSRYIIMLIYFSSAREHKITNMLVQSTLFEPLIYPSS
ncbi:hypothetical protein MSMTP_1243 [Methanosarcina sp. MTP4]|nr:hypothetical protein MSMTP_1243 [Methanosarcina sp. MTP4]